MPDTTKHKSLAIKQRTLEEMSTSQLMRKVQLLSAKAESEFYTTGISNQTHIQLRQVMQEFDNHLTFSAI